MYLSIKEIEAVDLAERVGAQGKPIKIIDVREFSEIRGGTIPGAIPMPLATVPLRLSEFEPHEEVVMICRTGARSAQACMFMQQQGFQFAGFSNMLLFLIHVFVGGKKKEPEGSFFTAIPSGLRCVLNLVRASQ